MPVLGIGTSQLGGRAGVGAVRHALEIGYRHIDTADDYGNHDEVGEAIQRSGVHRKEIFLTTKIPARHLTEKDVLRCTERYLSELGVEYIDLLLIHWPNRRVPIGETLGAMKKVRVAGKVRAIGVSNFTKHHLEDAFKTGVQVVDNQVEMHPSFNQEKLRVFCKEKGVAVTAYSPLGRSIELGNPLFMELAKKYNATEGQVILAWVLSKDVATIPKSKSPERLKENLGALELTLEPEDIKRIDRLPQGERLFEPASAEFEY